MRRGRSAVDQRAYALWLGDCDRQLEFGVSGADSQHRIARSRFGGDINLAAEGTGSV